MDDIQSDSYLKTSSNPVPPIGECTDKTMVLMDELRQQERQMSVSVIASMIAHFVGTPLNVIVGRAGLIRRHPDATEPIIKDALCIQQKVEQVTDKLRSLIDMLTPAAPTAQCEPDALITEAIELYRPIARMRKVELRIGSCPRGLPRVTHNPTFVVLTSLLSLGIHEVAAGSTIEVQATNGANVDGPAVQFMLSIPGCMFDDPRQLARFENPARTSVNALQVLGICAALARKAGGQLQTQAAAQTGSVLALQWPGASQFNL